MQEIDLHDYQKDGRNWLLRHRQAGLFLPPGLGKTLITLSSIDVLKTAKDVERVLVIAPIRVIYEVWPREVKKWDFDFKVGILHGPDKDSTVRKKHDIYLINPEGLKWLFENHVVLFTRFKFMLVCDESTLFKNNNSQRFKLLKQYLKLFERRVIMTGTPAPNGLLQLWPQIYILDHGRRLGNTIGKYRGKYFDSDYNGFGYVLRRGADAIIFKAVDDIIMHKSNNELDLPDLINNTINITLPDNIMKQYMQMKNMFAIELKDIDESVVAVNAAAKASKLKQIANGLVYGEDRKIIQLHDVKISACEELVESLGGRPLMIVYEHIHELNRLKLVFNAPHIGGGVSGKELNSIINDWNKGNIPVLLVHPKAAGHGLNLQDGGCHDVLWFSINFDLELYDQTNKRVHRQGVKNHVTIHHLVATGTVDEHIMKVLDGKSKLQDALLEALLK